MASLTKVNSDDDFVYYEIIFDETYIARLSVEIEDHDVSVTLWNIKEGREILYSSEYYNYIDGIENKLAALHHELDKLGLQGFPTDPNYIYEEMYKVCPEARPKIHDLGMTDEQYLAWLAENRPEHYR